MGDAAYAYYPISSYVITFTFASGYYARHALASKLNDEENAFEAYQHRMEQAFCSYLKELFIRYSLEK